MHRNISLENIRFDAKVKIIKPNSQSEPRLVNWATFFLTSGGTDVDFPIGNPLYLSIEARNGGARLADDVFALGILCLELYVGKDFVWDQGLSVLDALIDKEIDEPIMKSFVKMCLEKPLIQTILCHEFLKPYSIENKSMLWLPYPTMQSEFPQPEKGLDDPLSYLSLSQLFSLWKLENESSFEKREDVVPAILCLPLCIKMGSDLDKILQDAMPPPQSSNQSSNMFILELNALRDVIRDYDPLKSSKSSSYQSLLSQSHNTSIERHWKQLVSWNESDMKHFLFASSNKSFDSRFQLRAKENDVGYQYKRIVLFQRLLMEYPVSMHELILQSRIDIPPILRGRVWAALLGASGDTDFEYGEISRDEGEVGEMDKVLKPLN